jgi:hypothetical protein
VTTIQGEPSVRFRGIFINDEAPALTSWVRENFGGYNVEFYKKVFELLLRLKVFQILLNWADSPNISIGKLFVASNVARIPQSWRIVLYR